jgi:hypothetical protein
MTDTYQATANEPAVPPPTDITPIEERVDRPIDLGNDEANLREATREQQREREWEQGLHGAGPPDMGSEEEPTIARQKAGIVERKIQADYQSARTANTGLREVTQALSDQHWLERPEATYAREAFGMTPEQQLSARESEELRKQVQYTPEEWAEYQRSGQLKAEKPFLVNERGVREPIKDHERILQDATTRDVFRNARDATREMRLGREVNEAVTRQQQAEMEAAALGLQQQAPAAEAAQPAQPASPPQPAPAASQPQPRPDPLAAERQRLAFQARVQAELERSSVDEMRAMAQADQIIQAFPELPYVRQNPAAARDLYAKNPQRFAQLQTADQALQNCQAQFVKANEARQGREAQLSQAEQKHVEAIYTQYSRANDDAFVARTPEMKDTGRAHALRTATRQMLTDVGFTDDEVTSAWTGKTGVPLRDYRVQQLLADGARWRMAQASARNVTKANLPPVQKPGTFRPRGADSEADIARLERALEGASGERAALRAATALTQARRRAGL